MPKPTHRNRKPHTKLQLSVAPGVLEEVMDFMKTTDDEVALATLGKHARNIMKKYGQGRHITYWGVLDAYALLYITECKLMVKNEWDRAIADFEKFEKWQQTDSKLTHQQILVLNRFPAVLQYVLQQEHRIKLRADLPKITSAYTWEQYQMLKQLLTGAYDVLKISDLEE